MTDLYRIEKVWSTVGYYYRVRSPLGMIKGEWAETDDGYRRALELARQLNDTVRDTESEAQ